MQNNFILLSFLKEIRNPYRHTGSYHVHFCNVVLGMLVAEME